jgi:hypothetical protein
MGICRLDIPVACRDFTATLAAPLPYYATLVVLFHTTVAAFLCSQEPYSKHPWHRVLSDQATIRQPDCVFHKTKQALCAHEEFDSDLAPNLSTPGLHIKILQRTALEKQDQVERDQQY